MAATIHAFGSTGMQDLYERLSGLGFTRKFLRDCVLPDWWEDSMAAVPSNRAHVEVLISRQLGLALSALRDPAAPLRLEAKAQARYKRRQNLADGEFDVAQALGSRLATIAGLACEGAYHPADLSAGALRAELLSSRPWVGFEDLVQLCRRRGIPVVQLSRLPERAKRMDGMATWADSRPVIVIASRRKQPAWLLFILAHELGHIACGHVSPGSAAMVDSGVGPTAQSREEEEANGYAMELLTGNRDLALRPRLWRVTAAQLADSAVSLGKQLHIDPGVIALNYAWNQRFFQVGQAALRLLHPDGDGARVISSGYEHLCLDEIPDDTRRMFECLTAHCE